MNSARTLQALLLALLLLVGTAALAQVALPRLDVPVQDLTGTLTPEQIATLEAKLRRLDESKGARVAVVMLPTTAPETIEEFAIRLGDASKLGRQGVDDGVLVIIAKNDRAVRIEVGVGLQGVLPDVLANRMTDQVMVPLLRDGRYFEALDAALDRIIALVLGEPLPAPPQRRTEPRGIGSALPVVLMFVFVAGSLLRRLLGGFLGATAIGGIAGVIAWFITGTFLIGLGAALVAFFVTLFGGMGGGWTSGRGRGGWGGGFGGGGFGGGGGGSWGGGGGTFNGGGATGRW